MRWGMRWGVRLVGSERYLKLGWMGCDALEEVACTQ